MERYLVELDGDQIDLLKGMVRETNGLGIEVLTAQVGPDRHCSEKSSQNFLPVKWEMSARSRVLIWVS